MQPTSPAIHSTKVCYRCGTILTAAWRQDVTGWEGRQRELQLGRFYCPLSETAACVNRKFAQQAA